MCGSTARACVLQHDVMILHAGVEAWRLLQVLHADGNQLTSVLGISQLPRLR